MSDYRVLPIPPNMRGPSGEGSQIQVDGVVSRVSLFHGRADEELDWHVYITMDSSAASQIEQHLRANGQSVAGEDESRIYFELMLVDDWHRRAVTWPPWQASFQRRYDTADLTRPLRLVKAGSSHAAFEIAEPIANEPGKNVTISDNSLLFQHRGRVYMQGLFVRDVGHSPGNLEIHPPDSIAYAIDEDGRTLSATNRDDGWPARTVRWRVAWFANSAHHRVSGETPLKQERTTTWFLPLPGRVGDSPFPPAPPTNLQSFEITTTPLQLWDHKTDTFYDSRGVRTIEEAQIAVDPRDNRRKLRVSATMAVAGNRGGIIVRDYLVRVKPDVFDPGVDN